VVVVDVEERLLSRRDHGVGVVANEVVEIVEPSWRCHPLV